MISHWCGSLWRAIQKLIVGRYRYATRDGYAAEQYWRDRFRRHGTSMRGPGHEGRSEAENLGDYQRAAATFLEVLYRHLPSDVRECRFLEVGCGNGFYSRILREIGVKEYVGVDVTDELFPILRAEMPDFSFQKIDICAASIAETFDVVIVIDVIEHIVSDSGFRAAAHNLTHYLAPNGTLLINVPAPRSLLTRAFYLRFWSRQQVLSHFTELRLEASVPFRSGDLLAFRGT